MVVLGGVLILVGLLVLVVEAHASTGGILGLVAVLVAASGVGMLLAGEAVALVVAIPIAVALAVIGTVATWWLSRAVLAARQQELRAGPSVLIGAAAAVRTWSDDDEGQVAVDGTLWRAVMASGWQGPRPVPGQQVIVSALDGLTLSVRPSHPGK